MCRKSIFELATSPHEHPQRESNSRFKDENLASWPLDDGGIAYGIIITLPTDILVYEMVSRDTEMLNHNSLVVFPIKDFH